MDERTGDPEPGREQGHDADTAAGVAECLPLVGRLAHRLAGLAEADDLFQVGSVGLLRAARHFDPGRGVPLGAYALPYILGEMRALCRKQAAARGQRRMDLARRARQLGADLPVTALATQVGVPTEELAAVDAPPPPMPPGGDWPDSRDDPAASHWIERYDLRRAWSRLDPAARRLLVWRWVAERSQAEVGRTLGISQSQASRREQAALAQLRRQLADPPASSPGPPPV